MIPQVNNANVFNGYASTVAKDLNTSEKQELKISKQGDTSRVQEIKDALDSGEYKINLQALSKKIADELM
ncbi:flagellar biosynthesis anti-sigma factor FlgM [Sulfurimonas sp.]|uniref:flagellar biosynthesis anti-sigma factor FlgM n=1 Tax=Sulfurimonas sp. TaxID=2022749 RepID=UPI0025E50B48|nr:flagellar biosynthesis anti-sigma factor FlgM [Sulfurimonas sp.]MDD5158395.1 flagellar biosynthesis anti-sigma factor FlgM [Sulfurimonas sp.]